MGDGYVYRLRGGGSGALVAELVAARRVGEPYRCCAVRVSVGFGAQSSLDPARVRELLERVAEVEFGAAARRLEELYREMDRWVSEGFEVDISSCVSALNGRRVVKLEEFTDDPLLKSLVAEVERRLYTCLEPGF